MAQSVFGPKVSGVHVGPVHLGLTVQIFQADGEAPGCFTLMATSPLGNSTQMTVSNGGSTTLDVIANEATATISTLDWTANLPAAPTMCSFKVVIRVSGHFPIPILGQIPLNVQLDAYDVILHRSLADHAQAITALLQPA